MDRRYTWHLPTWLWVSFHSYAFKVSLALGFFVISTIFFASLSNHGKVSREVVESKKIARKFLLYSWCNDKMFKYMNEWQNFLLCSSVTKCTLNYNIDYTQCVCISMLQVDNFITTCLNTWWKIAHEVFVQFLYNLLMLNLFFCCSIHLEGVCEDLVGFKWIIFL